MIPSISNYINKDRVAKVAQMYRSNKDAAAAMGIASGSFSRLCRKFGVETPQQRRKRHKHEVG